MKYYVHIPCVESQQCEEYFFFSSLQNRPTGDCYVQLKTVDAASKACEQLHRQYIGNRYIEVFQVEREGRRS